MQINMHYHATYAMARAAGIEPDEARIIATSAQFVDDNIAGSHVELRDGSRIDREATAHHPFYPLNLDDQVQRRVWVPFHVIPGQCRRQLHGTSQVPHGQSGSPRIAGPPSDIRRSRLPARPPRRHGTRVYRYLPHYGFSGVSSRGNKVDISRSSTWPALDKAPYQTHPSTQLNVLRLCDMEAALRR